MDAWVVIRAIDSTFYEITVRFGSKKGLGDRGTPLPVFSERRTSSDRRTGPFRAIGARAQLFDYLVGAPSNDCGTATSSALAVLRLNARDLAEVLRAIPVRKDKAVDSEFSRANERPSYALGVPATFTKAHIQARRRQGIKQPLYVIVHGIRQREGGDSETQCRHQRKRTPWELEVLFACQLPFPQLVIERRQLAFFRQAEGPFNGRRGRLDARGLRDGFGGPHRTTGRSLWISAAAKRSLVHD
jgi:hypothetical protein